MGKFAFKRDSKLVISLAQVTTTALTTGLTTTRFWARTKVLSMVLALATGLAVAASAAHAATEPIKVCASLQLYQSLKAFQEISPTPIWLSFGTNNDLYARIIQDSAINLNDSTTISSAPAASVSQDKHNSCELLFASDERLPINLIRAHKAKGSGMVAFVRAPLVLWTNTPEFFHSGTLEQLFSNPRFNSLAIAKPELTPVGFASGQFLAHEDIKSLVMRYLRQNIVLRKTNQEYQTYSLVASQAVQAGIVSKPLVAKAHSRKSQDSLNTAIRTEEGYYWEIPRHYHPDIQYYMLVLGKSYARSEVVELMNFVLHDKKSRDLFNAWGLSPLTPES